MGYTLRCYQTWRGRKALSSQWLTEDKLQPLGVNLEVSMSTQVRFRCAVVSIRVVIYLACSISSCPLQIVLFKANSMVRFDPGACRMNIETFTA